LSISAGDFEDYQIGPYLAIPAGFASQPPVITAQCPL